MLIRQHACPFALQKNKALSLCSQKKKSFNKLKTYDIDIYYKYMCHQMGPLALGTEPFWNSCPAIFPWLMGLSILMWGTKILC